MHRRLLVMVCKCRLLRGREAGRGRRQEDVEGEGLVAVLSWRAPESADNGLAPVSGYRVYAPASPRPCPRASPHNTGASRVARF